MCCRLGRSTTTCPRIRASGGFERPLASITARTILVPPATDAYFSPVDNEHEAHHISHFEEVRRNPHDLGAHEPDEPTGSALH